MKKRNLWKRLCAGALAALMMIGNLSGVSTPVSAATTVYGGLGVKEADPATVNGWEDFYTQPDTSLAGGVWTDKSVFESAQDYFAATHEQERFDMELENPRDFLISLSAMASTKTIVGYSTLPTDTVFVLDVSGSMDDTSNRDARMVEAANKAIGDLLALNNYNRVGVVLYSGDAMVLLPLDRYTTSSTTTLNNETIPSYIYLTNRDYVSVSSGVRNSENQRISGSREVVGATHIQHGIYTAMEQLTAPDLETVITEGFQVGTTRTPIVVLMSDGAPTYATNTYTAINGSYNMGNGSSSSTTADMAFVTQLTAAWAKEKIGEKYSDEVTPLFYTLGLGVGSNSYAMSVMDPNNAAASTEANNYWTAFDALNEGEGVSLVNHTYWQNGRYQYRQAVKMNDGANDGVDKLPIRRNYVDRYFPASSSNQLSQAFQSIVDTIILQTMYYPTLVEGGDVHHGGYLEFRDYIGPNMEVKQVEGVQMGDTLYTGEAFARLVATGMGTVNNPTEAGNELVHSIITRLKLGRVGDAQAAASARDLLQKAWNAGQLAYNTDYDGNVTWSNWFGWYADENDRYLGFWDGEGIDEDMKGKAEYAVKSYLVLGEVGEGHRETDMLYASIQVRSHLDEQGSVLEDVVFGRLPASLIPMVEYLVELDSNDPATATQITLTIDGAEAPSRLIYEVGLRKELDLLNLEGSAVEELKTDANGNFIFYTNQWDTTGLEEGNHPNKLHNTYMNFFPSEENERYYYHEDMPIYVKNAQGNYVRYSGSRPAAGDGRTYYRAYSVYTAAESGGEAAHTVDWQEIPAGALERVAPVEGTNRWVVKKGTLYRSEARAAVGKTANDTGTLPYSEYGVIHNDAAMGYHLDAILGNNGLLTIDPPEGLKLTKEIDETLTDDGQVYTFHVELTSGSLGNAPVYLVTETDGVRSGWQEVTFTNNVFTVELAAGDSAWLAGLPEDSQYTITEEIGGQYEVSEITVDGQAADEAVVEIVKGHITDVKFTNSAVFTGDVLISKTVDSTYAPHETDAYKFPFTVTVENAEQDEYDAVLILADGSEGALPAGLTTDGNGEGQLTVELAHGQAVKIFDLPEGAVVTAEEQPLPGFTSDQTNHTASASVAAGTVTVLPFVNTYEAEPVSPGGKVDLYVHKDLQGRDWAAEDKFTFVLVKPDGNKESVTVDGDYAADFQSNGEDLFTEAGTYSYRVYEEPGDLAGVAYDTAVCYFDIVVADDGEGSLYIENVVGRQDVEVLYDQASETWDVTCDFTNVYSAEGAVQASLSVRKDIDDDAETGISKAGFTFELYETDEVFQPVGKRAEAVTNGQGVAAFRDTLFTEEGTFFYLLKEAPSGIANMKDSEQEYRITVDVTSDPQTSGLAAEAVILDDEGYKVYEGQAQFEPDTETIPVLSWTAEFTNRYEPEAAETVITGAKTLTGRDLSPNDPFVFALYEADEDFKVGDYITEVGHTDGTFVFEDLQELTFAQTGTYCFAVKEQAGTLGGVTYDDSTFFVTVRVTADTEHGALVINSQNVTDETGASRTLAFHNTYSPAPVDEVLEAEKSMTGTRQLAANMFQFQLFETADDYQITGEALQTVYNDGQGKAAFPLHYAAVGTHYYVIRERIPANVGADGRLNGVLYDTAEYRVQVTVRDNLEGELVTEVLYLDGAPAFVNDYTPASTSVTLSGSKALAGRNQTAGEFSFSLYETDAKFVPVDSAAEDTAVNVSDGQGGFSFTFEELTYTQPGGYRYLIVENDTGDHQIDYDGTVFYVLVSVTDNGQGQLTAKTTVGRAVDGAGMITDVVTDMEFYNVFNHAPAELTLTGRKLLQDQAWNADGQNHAFTFELYTANEEFVPDGAALDTAKNDPAAAGREGEFAFDKLTFEEEGTYYYVVKEQLPDGIGQDGRKDGILYDTTVHHVTVTVEEDPADPLKLKAAYTLEGGSQAITFTNRYTATGSVLAAISGTKVMEGRTLHTDGFAFTLTDAEGNEIETVYNGGDGTASEGPITFRPLTFTAEGTYTYTVTENAHQVPGVAQNNEVWTVTIEVGHDNLGNLTQPVVTYSKDGKTEAAMVFTNTYKAEASEPLALGGTKTLVGAVLTNEFTFQLYSATVDGNGVFTEGALLEEVVNDGSRFTFTGRTYSEAGEAYYIIREKAGAKTGMTYDDNEFYVTVHVEDPGDGKLTAHVESIDRKEHTVAVGVHFTNTFTPAPITAAFDGTKTLTGRDMKDGEFTFELYQTGADYLVAEGTTALDTAENVDGAFSFEPVTLDSVGAYYYVVKEVKGTASRVTYDATVYHILVTVSNRDGVLEKTVTMEAGGEAVEEITFHNRYRKPDPQPDPMEVELEVQKVLKGGDDLQGFEFLLVDTDGDVVDTAVSDRNGKAALTVGTFRKADAGETYTFYVVEKDTNIPGMTYSTKEYKVRITVEYDSNRNRLTYELSKDGQPVDRDEPLIFTNLYHPGGGDPTDPVPPTPVKPGRPSSPDTGDVGAGQWIAMTILGASGFMAMLVLLILRRRKNA